MTSPPDEHPADPPAEEPERRASPEDLDRPARDRSGTWRDQPKALACAVVGAFLLLTTVAFGVAVLLIVLAAR